MQISQRWRSWVTPMEAVVGQVVRPVAGHVARRLGIDLERLQDRFVPQIGPWADHRFIVVDTETTGLDAEQDVLLSVAAVDVVHGKVDLNTATSWLVQPGREIPTAATAIHGISNEDVADAPSISEVARQIEARLAGGTLVGHNLAFDTEFLSRAGIHPQTRAAIDTIAVSRALDPNPLSKHNLDVFTRRMGVRIQGRHTAYGDAIATAQALSAALPRLHRLSLDSPEAVQTFAPHAERDHSPLDLRSGIPATASARS